jgi:pre-mRNA-splicing factor 18
MLLTEWEAAMLRRSDDVKESYTGKIAFNAMVQAKSNLIPFFRKMEKGDIEDTVLEGVLEIVHAAQERRYVDANDGYLRLSIGKAAWPIGVTMVGIHERSAREKLHESDNTAHIMSDETTRKYLQGIKRCLSFAQTRWPPDDQLQLMG